jgi:hypothetical protein
LSEVRKTNADGGNAKSKELDYSAKPAACASGIRNARNLCESYADCCNRTNLRREMFVTHVIDGVNTID